MDVKIAHELFIPGNPQLGSLFPPF